MAPYRTQQAATNAHDALKAPYRRDVPLADTTPSRPSSSVMICCRTVCAPLISKPMANATQLTKTAVTAQKSHFKAVTLLGTRMFRPDPIFKLHCCPTE